MKSEPKIKAASVIPLTVLISIFIIVQSIHGIKLNPSTETSNKSELLLSDNILDKKTDVSENNIENNVTEDNGITVIESNDENISTEVVETPVVYDGLTRDELVAKINKNLNSTLSGKGDIFVDYALSLGLDPYLATAIVLHETGCSWECSYLVKACNNVGGQKGGPSCDGGSYKAYASLDEGIKGFMDNLYNNYYALGLTTPETINPKYAASTAWAGKINYYMQMIKAS
ncbi:MAG: glucosaminidase domain-containing protein [Bacilli bacterium]|nr:glucosaminidase domain-containing protein [Bacilli bacterium]